MRALDRRRFLALALSSVAASRQGFAQQRRVYRIGVLRPTAAADATAGDSTSTFLPNALRELGYAQDQDFVIDMRFAENNIKRLPELARGLVAAKADVILAVGAAATREARAATTSIPIVFFGNFDPVKLGFVKSLAQPGGNVTGIVIAPDGTLTAKKVELLAQSVPGIKRMAMLLPPDPYVAAEQVPEARKTAASLGIDLFTVEVRDNNYDQAFEKMAQLKSQALFVTASTYFMRDRKPIISLAARYKLPAMYEWPDQVEDGGLMAYGPTSLRAIYTRIAAQIDRILKGAQASELAVEQPTKLELVINMKTARALGLTIPQAVLLRAERVIE